MPDAAEILIFDVAGRTREPRGATLIQRLARLFHENQSTSGTPPAASKKPSADEPDQPDLAVRSMNARADELARELEGEILAALPPDPTLSVQAELRFHKGSLAVVGTVAVLSWAGSIVLETAKNELAELIKIATQRVLAGAIAQLPQAAGASLTMQCSVKPRSRSVAAAEPVLAAEPVPAVRPGVAAWQGGVGWRDIVLVVLTLAVLILLFNSLFDVRLREPSVLPTTPPVPAPATP